MQGNQGHPGMAGHSGHDSLAGNSGHTDMTGHSDHNAVMYSHNRFLQMHTSARLIVEEWSSESIYGLTGAMLAAVAVSITYECLSEYLQHIKRKAFLRRSGPGCCGSPLVTVGEKLGQTIIQLLRVIFSFFMMLCVMTMNVWLLVAVCVGAFVGYGVGKPLLANRIEDTLTSHGYDTVSASVNHRGNNKSERSRSWRYQPIIKTNQVLKTRQDDTDDIFFEGEDELDCNAKHIQQERNGADIVW
ncbi:uncharacterized protein LOC132756639, partial [Ruditapes philippinarum]|uniref:uncharacterized protein LOC132756639 n=1 Tax=Ruditapes philippinarum TaxID=129788 RepID=UPI00295AC195